MNDPCARCGTPGIVGRSHPRLDYAYWILEPAQRPGGLCAVCAAHWWIFSVDSLRWSFRDGPGVLIRADVQAAIARLLSQMHPELAALDWDRLLAQWDLPWPRRWELPSDAQVAP